MPEEPTIDPELTRLAASLAGLTPATPALDRDRLFYEAGCRARAVAPRTWTWPLATALAASLTFGLGLRLAPPPAPVLVPQVVEGKVAAPVSPPSPEIVPETFAVAPGLHPGAEALRRREQRLLWDSEMLPSLTVSVPTESVESLLGIRRGSLTDLQLQRFKAALSQGDI
jgi:hypothetical protein